MADRASILGAAETSVGKVREHNEDSHFADPERGIFLVCDGMGGHAAGEVASSIAVQTIRERWASNETTAAVDRWLETGAADARRTLIATVQDGVLAAHDAILEEARRDRTKGGMGTTLVGAIIIGGDAVFAHAGDSRAYLVRDGIAMQLTEDHTLLARLLAAGVDVDTSGDGGRFKSMLTNALGIGDELKVSTFIVPLADGDRFLLCSDGITEYVQEAEIGEALCQQPSPARAAQKLVELALARGGGDNATALVVRVVEAGVTARATADLKREQKAIDACPLWKKVTPQQRLRALRIALPRELVDGEVLAASTLGDRVGWIVLEGDVEQHGDLRPPGSLIYPEALLADRPLPDKESLARAVGDVRVFAVRADDFRELCEDDSDLGEALLAALASEIAARAALTSQQTAAQVEVDPTGVTDPELQAIAVEQRAATQPLHPEDDTATVRIRPPDVTVPEDAAPEPVVDETVPIPRVAAAVRSGTLPPATRRMTPFRGSTSQGLLGGKADHAETEAAVDEALAKISGDELPSSSSATRLAAVSTHDEVSDEPESVIEVEADAPEPRHHTRIPSRPSSPRLGDHSDAEISIEQLDNADSVEPPVDDKTRQVTATGEPDVDDPDADPPDIEIVASSEGDARDRDRSEPEIIITRQAEPPAARDELSEPEIMIIKSGRPITANEGPLVAGTIDEALARAKPDPD